MTTETTPTPPAAAPPPAVEGTPPAAGAAPPVVVPPAAGEGTALAGAVEGAKPPEGTKPPETKVLELVAPKGYEQVVDLLKSSTKELGLEGEKAQKFAESLATIEAARTKQFESALTAQEAKWLEESKADPDIGGAKWDASMKAVSVALKRFGGPIPEGAKMSPLAALLTRAGLGNNKLVLKAFADIGRAVADDTIQGTAKSAPPAGERVSDATALYGTPASPAA